jgi:hypothetical protein
MGIKYAHALTYILKNIDVSQLCHISRCIRDQNNRNCLPCIDVDCSLVIRSRGYSNINTNTYNNAQYLIEFAKTFTCVGFDEMLVFDGTYRHHSKRLTLQRSSGCRRNEINLLIEKSELMSLTENDAIRIVLKKKTN